MNARDIELPPVSEALGSYADSTILHASSLVPILKNYAGIAVEADRKRRGEAVYLFRRKGLREFVTCDKERYLELTEKPNLFETRVLYAAPQPAEPVKPCDCERGHNGMGLTGRECDCPAKPVKVPSDDEIISLAREYGGCFARSSRMLQFDFEQPGILNFARALLARYGHGDN